MLRGCSNLGVTHTPSGCETLPQRVVLNAFWGRLAIDFWGERTRSLLGWRFGKKSHDFAKNHTVLRKKKQNPQFGGKLLGWSFRADSRVVNPRQIWFWTSHPENAMDSRPRFQRMPFNNGGDFSTRFRSQGNL